MYRKSEKQVWMLYSCLTDYGMQFRLK